METVKKIFYSETKDFYRLHLTSQLIEEQDLFSYPAKHVVDESLLIEIA